MQVVKAFNEVPNSMFTIAAAFGNCHGVYKVSPLSLNRLDAFANANLRLFV